MVTSNNFGKKSEILRIYHWCLLDLQVLQQQKKCPFSEGTVLATNPAVSFSRSCPYINCLKLLQEFFRESDNLIEYSVRQGILETFRKLRYTVKICEGIFWRFGSTVALWVYIKPKTFFPKIFFSSVCRGKMVESAR